MSDVNVQDISLTNQEFLSAIEQAPDGQLKNASASSTQVLRRRVRESGFARSILPFKPAGAAVQRLPDNDMPVIVEDMEPDSPGAKAVPFMGSPDTVFYHGDTFLVMFHKIVSPEFKKNIHQLQTYKHDLKAMVTDNALRDIHTTEDQAFISQVDDLVGPDGVTGPGASGEPQNFGTNDGIIRSMYPLHMSYLEDRELMNGVFLMNRKTAKAFLTWNRSEIGGDLAQAIFEDGASAISKGKILGVPHIYTSKKALVPHNVEYQFAEPDYLGRAYVLQDLVLYIEKRKDIITFSAMEKIGITIGNVAAVNKVTFHTSTWNT